MKNLKTLRMSAVTFVLSALLLLSIGCQPASSTADGVTSDETVTVFRGDLSASTGATGKLTADRLSELALDSGGEVIDVPVSVGDWVNAGETVVQLNSSELSRAVDQAAQNVLSLTAALADLQKPPTAAELAAAEEDVAAAQSRLEKLVSGPTSEDIAVSEANLRAAEADVWAAVNRLNAVQNGATPADVQAAQLEVDAAQRAFDSAHDVYLHLSKCTPNDSGTHNCTFDRSQEGGESIYWQAAEAQANLDQAQAVLNNLSEGNPQAITVAQVQVSVVAARRDVAQAQHDLLLAGASQAEIAAAEASLAQARANLIDLQDGPKPEQVAIAVAQLEQARLDLAQAEHNLAQASLTAPYSGVITAVHLRVGEQAAGPAVTLVDRDSLVLALNVNEIDLRHVAVGQTAQVRLEAWPDQLLQGTVTVIAPVNQSQGSSNAVVYRVQLQLEETALPLRLGMTGNADLITAERRDVLLLANRAITTNFETGESFVNLVEGGPDGETVIEVPVTIGVRSGQFSEILDGLQEGDAVRIIAAPPPAANIWEE